MITADEARRITSDDVILEMIERMIREAALNGRRSIFISKKELCDRAADVLRASGYQVVWVHRQIPTLSPHNAKSLPTGIEVSWDE